MDNKSGASIQENTEKRLEWYGHVRRMKEEHIVRIMLDVDIPGKRRRGRSHLMWKYACKRDMTQAGLSEYNTTNRAAWRKTLIIYNGDHRWRDKQGWRRQRDKQGRTEEEANQLYRRPQIDDGTSKGWRRQRNKHGRTEEEANQLYRWPHIDDGTRQGWRRQRNKHGRTEEEANQLYRRPQMTGQARDEEDNATNREERRKNLISYTGDPRWRDKPGMKKTTQQTWQNGGRS